MWKREERRGEESAAMSSKKRARQDASTNAHGLSSCPIICHTAQSSRGSLDSFEFSVLADARTTLLVR